MIERQEASAPSGIAGSALLWLVLVGVALGHTYFVHSRLVQPAEAYAAQVWQASGNTRPLTDLPRVADVDSAYYVKFAQALREPDAPHLRLRSTDVDGPPGGREVHWAQLNTWWLVLLGGPREVVTGELPAVAILRASVWASPLLLFLGVAAWSLVLFRFRLGAACLVLMAGILLHPETYTTFGYGFPDHHGWHAWAAMGLILGLALRLMLPREGNPARLGAWGHVSAASGGICLWLGASQAVIIYGLICIAIFLAAFLLRRRGHDSDPTVPPAIPAEFWRFWSVAGALWGLGFYLLEYAPKHFGMRLEVNHPLYLAAWAAAGEFLCRWQRLTSRPWREGTRSDWGVLVLCLLPMLLPALALALGPKSWLLIRDTTLQRAMALTWEGRNVLFWLRDAGRIPYSAYPQPAWLAATAFLFIKRRRFTQGEFLALLSTYLLCTGLFGLALLQGRWLGQASFVGAALGLVVLRLADANQRKYWATGIIAGYALLFIAANLNTTWRLPVEPFKIARAYDILARADLAYYFRDQAREDNRRPYVLSTPDPVTLTLFLHSPARLLRSMYWENTTGNRQGYELLVMDDEDQLRREFQRLGLTHVIVSTKPAAVQATFETGLGRPVGPKGALIVRLAHPQPIPPDWLVPAEGLDPDLLGIQDLRIYKVVPPSDDRPLP